MCDGFDNLYGTVTVLRLHLYIETYVPRGSPYFNRLEAYTVSCQKTWLNSSCLQSICFLTGREHLATSIDNMHWGSFSFFVYFTLKVLLHTNIFICSTRYSYLSVLFIENLTES